MATPKSSSPAPSAQSWSRRYPPITVALASAILIALIVLPSALNIPQTNPTTIAEYAPVPPEDDAPPDTTGNISALGLGSSSSLQKGIPVAAGELPSPEGRRRINKRCVGKPARQTEDPMSPPCVPFFEGDNGGSTWQGVTRDEIKVLVYSEFGTYNTGEGFEDTPAAGSYCDIDLPANSGGRGCYVPNTTTDHGHVKFVRALSRFFNARFQTYERRVHFWMYFSAGGGAAARKAEAADNWEKLRPFAVIDNTFARGNDTPYYEAMTRRKAMIIPTNFSSPPPLQAAASYQRLAPYLWEFIPDVEHWMQTYVSYVCKRVVPFPVAHAQGGIGKDLTPMEGDARRLGLIYENSAANPQFPIAAQLLRDGLAGCGGKLWADAGYNAGADDGTVSSRIVAEMRDKDVTTILSVGVNPTVFSQVADGARYYPEVVFAGDGFIDRNSTARAMAPNWMRNGWMVTYLIGSLRLDEDHGFRACAEGDSSLTRANCQLASQMYRDHFMLFKLIQAGGPRLNPRTVDRGMHSIPRVSSRNYSEASCYFDPGDYTCVKDGMEQWWDSAGRVPGAQSPGCWRMVSGGKRYLPSDWPSSDDVFDNQSDPCNAYTLGGPTDP